MASLKQQTVSGVKWNGIATFNNALVQMAKLFILARLISKADFGIIAIALLVIGFTEIFANLGFSVGLIHKQEITQRQYSSLYWVNLALSVLLYGVLCLLTPFLTNYYNEPMLTKVIPLLSLQLVISAFGKMFQTLKMKELDFKFISIVNMVGVYSGAILTIILAIAGYGVMSLVWGMLLQTAVIQFVYAISGWKRYHILLHCNFREITDFVRIGGYQVGTQVLDYAASKLDIFLIGRFFGMEILGIYNLAKELVLKVIQIVNPIVTTVATPAFAKFQHDLVQMRQSYQEVLHLLSLVNFPVFAAFFVFAEPITLWLYGAKMIEVAFFLRWLSLWGLFQSVGNPAGILMVSLGRTDLGFVWTLVRVSITTLVVLIAGQFSITIMTYAQIGLAMLFFIIYWKMMIYKMIQLPFTEYCRAVSLPFITMLGAAIAAAAIIVWNNTLLLQILGILIFIGVYVGLNLVFNRAFISKICQQIIPKKTL